MSHFSRHSQRGDVLIEALVGVVITALIGAGMAHVTARIVSSQHDSAVDALVVNDLRNVMQVSGVDLCNDAGPLAEKRGLPEALHEGVALSVADCAAATEEVVEIGGVSFQGMLPPAVEVTASKGEEELLTVSSVVAPAGRDGQ